MLTGHTKKMFQEWCTNNLFMNDTLRTIINYDDFLYYPFSMQSGVYLKFLREQGKIIEVYSQSSKPKLTYGYKIVQDGGNLLDDGFSDYNTALTQAITQAGVIYNERVK